MKYTGAQIIVKLLEMYGIETVAGIPGGSILPLYDELNRSSIRHVLVRHEQAAGFFAQGMARSTGKPAVCLATSGPGAMNLLTAIADARADSIPIIAITGQVNTTLIGTDAFQEADTFGLSFPITKHSIMVKNPYELLEAIPKAFEIALKGRPGPVLIDVPRDVQLKECDFDVWPDIKKVRLHDIKFHTPIDEYSEKIGLITEALSKAKRPVLYCGGGCNSEEAVSGIKSFLQNYRLPVVTSLMGIGCIPESSEMYIGMVGMHGNHAANVAMHDSDLVIAAGVRFDDRATGVVSKFCPDAKIIHIDIDAAEVDKIIPASISVVADVESVFPVIAQLIAEKKITSDEGWLKKMAKLRKEHFSLECGRPKNEKLTNPRELISKVPEYAEAAGMSKDKLIATTDVGQHQMWAAQYYPVERPRSFLTSGSLGTMGFGLPTAIGASVANPDCRVVCFSGDGSIMMNVQEMATLAELNLPVTVIVFQNGTLGMVYQQQKFLFDKNYSASVFGRSPDLLEIARGFGIEAIDADSDAEWYKKAFDNNRQNKPCFVRVSVDSEENVLPFVPGGKANIDSIRD
ncbi:acetolactate synthase, large subunit [Treponema bryantii]|uniref:Acetolactate synthase n=1 Tax=Treponema bryantii TaxID=163 RepID=A0A1H9EIY6_9SPIR|nr:biosynthetic-type acetolactate synthase large subunit [Treponema bryantii]SEQ25641.1 acetolactate synthase, large subunit [Treponema bryantii]